MSRDDRDSSTDGAQTGGEQARAAAEAVARRSYGKLVAFLAARTRDVAAAEDALSEAFAAALADWPVSGCPANPEGWLLTVARRKVIDMYRGQRRDEHAGDELRVLGFGLDEGSAGGDVPAIPDQRLALVFACAHPAIAANIRAPLILQVVMGLDAKRIASAFLMSPAAMGKRLVRAKEKIRQAGIPFRVPEREELGERLDAVLGAIYGAFAEGWADLAGTDGARRDLAEEAIFLCRVVTELLPGEPEAAGLAWRVCTVGGAGFRVVGRGDDCRSGGASAASERNGLDWKIPVRRSAAICACAPSPRGSRELGGSSAALRRADGGGGFAGGGGQSSACDCRAARRGAGARCDAGGGGRPAIGGISAVLGGTC